MNINKLLNVLQIINYNQRDKFINYCRTNWLYILTKFFIHNKRLTNKQITIKITIDRNCYFELEILFIRYNEIYIIYNSFAYKFNNYIQSLQFIKTTLLKALNYLIYKKSLHLKPNYNKILIYDKNNNIVANFNTMNINTYTIITELTKRIFK